MSKTFFVSDYHFFHSNIIKYCDRPFDDVYKMNSTIIRNHNQRVSDDDTVYFLGDFGFFASRNKAINGEGEPYNPEEMLSKMNGKNWYFIQGNHDKSSNKFKPKADTIILNQHGLRIQLIHDPQYAKIDYDLILCGHVHNYFKVKELFYNGQSRLIINCSVDVWDYNPIKLDEILSIYHRWKKERNSIKKWEYPSILNELNQGTIISRNNNEQ
jgi:calcineurin-like phosphoesterase family protein